MLVCTSDAIVPVLLAPLLLVVVRTFFRPVPGGVIVHGPGQIILPHGVNFGQLALARHNLLGEKLDVVQFFLSALAKEIRVFPGELGHDVSLVVHLERLVAGKQVTLSISPVSRKEISDGKNTTLVQAQGRCLARLGWLRCDVETHGGPVNPLEVLPQALPRTILHPLGAGGSRRRRMLGAKRSALLLERTTALQ